MKDTERVVAHRKALAKENGEATSAPPDLTTDVQWDDSDSDESNIDRDGTAQGDAVGVEDLFWWWWRRFLSSARRVFTVCALATLILGTSLLAIPGTQ